MNRTLTELFRSNYFLKKKQNKNEREQTMKQNYNVHVIAACDKNFAIGYKNHLPWPRMKRDMQFFKSKTIGNVVIMGRTTFESLGSKPLPNRTNFVISKSLPKQEGITVFRNLDSCFHFLDRMNDNDVYIIGGQDIYKQALEMNQTKSVYLNQIGGVFDADAWFPVDLLQTNSFVLQEQHEEMENDVTINFMTFKR
jgi:dihydrofolate reductase